MNKIIILLCCTCLVLISCGGGRQELQPFFRMNDSLVNCNKTATEKNNAIYAQFDKQKALESVKILAYWQKAQTAKKAVAEMTAYIENMKAEIISRESGITRDQARTVDLQNVRKLRKYAESTRYLIGSTPDGSKGAAHDLKLKICDYKKIMILLVDSADRKQIEKDFGLKVEEPCYDANNTKETWEQYNFYQTMLVADIVILNRLINEVKNAEGKVITRLFSEAGVKE